MESNDLRDQVLNALADRLSDSGAMATGHFVLVAEVLDGDGTHSIFVANPPSQPTHATMGLMTYGAKFFETEAYIQMLNAMESEDDEDDD